MKVKSALENFFLKRTNTIDTLLEKSAQKFTVEDFHQIRVEIKKLNALFKLINFCLKKFEKKKQFRSFRSIFKQAGKVRELQLEEAALKKYAHFSGLKKYILNLKKVQQKEKKNFFLLINKDLKTKLKKSNKNIPSLIEKKINKKDAKSYLDNRRERIERLTTVKYLKLEKVHELRKLIKEFYYNSKSLNLSKEIKLQKETDALQNLLGKWHDCQVIEEHLNEVVRSKTAMKPLEIKELKKAKNKLSSDGEILLKKINTAIYKEKVLEDLVSP